MFALDRSLHCIEATEQEVVAVYRSAAAVAVSPPGAKHMTSEAFICVVRKDEQSSVYVALAEAGNKSVLIFTRGKGDYNSKSIDDPLKAALGFAESMGFSMETVNLDYGRALREVVVRSIRVIHDPRNGKKRVDNTPIVKSVDLTPPPKQQLSRQDGAGSVVEHINEDKMPVEKVTEKLETEKVEAHTAREKAGTGHLEMAKKEVASKSWQKRKRIGKECLPISEVLKQGLKSKQKLRVKL